MTFEPSGDPEQETLVVKVVGSDVRAWLLTLGILGRAQEVRDMLEEDPVGEMRGLVRERR